MVFLTVSIINCQGSGSEMAPNEAQSVWEPIQSPVIHKTLPQDGYQIHYYTAGPDTGTPIVFLHPAFGDHHAFDQQIDAFASQYPLITMDMMGHGLSQVGSSSDKIDKTADHIVQILNREGHKKAHLVGVSMGSLQAQYFALQYPEMTASLTVLGGYDINGDNAEVNKAQRSENLKWIFKALFSMPSFRRYISEVSCSDATSQSRMRAMAEHFSRRSFRVMSGLGKVIQKRDTPIRTYPMMIMVGEGDIELSQKMSALFHAREPSSHFVVLAGAGHCANMDQADSFNEKLWSFLE